MAENLISEEVEEEEEKLLYSSNELIHFLFPLKKTLKIIVLLLNYANYVYFFLFFFMFLLNFQPSPSAWIGFYGRAQISMGIKSL
jgi:hypothetical protein